MASSLNSRLLFKREYQEPSRSTYLIKAVEGHYRQVRAGRNNPGRQMLPLNHLSVLPLSEGQLPDGCVNSSRISQRGNPALRAVVSMTRRNPACSNMDRVPT